MVVSKMSKRIDVYMSSCIDDFVSLFTLTEIVGDAKWIKIGVNQHILADRLSTHGMGVLHKPKNSHVFLPKKSADQFSLRFYFLVI